MSGQQGPIKGHGAMVKNNIFFSSPIEKSWMGWDFMFCLLPSGPFSASGSTCTSANNSSFKSWTLQSRMGMTNGDFPLDRRHLSPKEKCWIGWDFKFCVLPSGPFLRWVQHMHCPMIAHSNVELYNIEWAIGWEWRAEISHWTGDTALRGLQGFAARHSLQWGNAAHSSTTI